MVDKNHTYQIISVILLIAVIAFAGLYFTKSAPFQEVNEQTCSEFISKCPEEKALIFGLLNSWGEDYYDSGKNVFTVEVYNFGNVEARNVEVICEINVGDEEGYTISDTPIATITKKIGNIASTSYKYVDLENNKDRKKEGEYPLAFCRVNSCENCEILDERIPELR